MNRKKYKIILRTALILYIPIKYNFSQISKYYLKLLTMNLNFMLD